MAQIGLNLTLHTAAKPEYAVEAFFWSLTVRSWGQHEIVTLHAIEYWHGVIAYFEVPIGVFGAGIKKHRGHGIEYALKLLFGLLENIVTARLIWRLLRYLSDGAFIKSDLKPLMPLSPPS